MRDAGWNYELQDPRHASRLAQAQTNALVADEASDTDAIRTDLDKQGIKALIPPKSSRAATIR
jgi:hypothetical protein